MQTHPFIIETKKALQTKDFTKVKELLDTKREFVDLQDENGDTIFHHIVTHANEFSSGLDLETLMVYKPNPFIKNNSGFTAGMCLPAPESVGDLWMAGMINSYENAYQAECLSYALESQALIDKNQIMEHTVSEPKTLKGYPLPKRTIHSAGFRQPKVVVESRSQLAMMILRLRGQNNALIR